MNRLLLGFALFTLALSPAYAERDHLDLPPSDKEEELSSDPALRSDEAKSHEDLLREIRDLRDQVAALKAKLEAAGIAQD